MDNSFRPDDIISNVLIPEEIRQLPSTQVLSIEWPQDICLRPEERVEITDGAEDSPLSHWSIALTDYDAPGNAYRFSLERLGQRSVYELKLNGTTPGFTVKPVSGLPLHITVGSSVMAAEAYFEEAPPTVLYVDGSELEGHFFVQPKNWSPAPIPYDRLVTRAWTGVDIEVESIWKDGNQRLNSVQYYVAQEYLGNNYDVVFDDDGSGEAADLVCLRELPDAIELDLVHCKFSGGPTPGTRVADVVEVASQAVRAVRWLGRFGDLCTHIRHRAGLTSAGRTTRFVKGDLGVVTRFFRLSRIKPVRLQIIAAQPGIHKAGVTEAQLTVLSAAHGYLLDTAEVGLTVLCSS